MTNPLDDSHSPEYVGPSVHDPLWKSRRHRADGRGSEFYSAVARVIYRTPEGKEMPYNERPR